MSTTSVEVTVCDLCGKVASDKVAQWDDGWIWLEGAIRVRVGNGSKVIVGEDFCCADCLERAIRKMVQL